MRRGLAFFRFVVGAAAIVLSLSCGTTRSAMSSTLAPCSAPVAGPAAPFRVAPVEGSPEESAIQLGR